MTRMERRRRRRRILRIKLATTAAVLALTTASIVALTGGAAETASEPTPQPPALQAEPVLLVAEHDSTYQPVQMTAEPVQEPEPVEEEDENEKIEAALLEQGYYEGLQAILRRIEFNTGLAYGDLSDPATVEKTATEVMSAKIRKFNTVKALEDRFKAALENAVYGVDVYATLYGLAPRGEYELYIDFDDSILTDKDALRERDRQDVRDGLMQKWEYRVKWYNETEEVAKSMCPVESTADPFNLG